jgi:hypothetical protein
MYDHPEKIALCLLVLAVLVLSVLTLVKLGKGNCCGNSQKSSMRGMRGMRGMPRASPPCLVSCLAEMQASGYPQGELGWAYMNGGCQPGVDQGGGAYQDCAGCLQGKGSSSVYIDPSWTSCQNCVVTSC